MVIYTQSSSLKTPLFPKLSKLTSPLFSPLSLSQNSKDISKYGTVNDFKETLAML